MGEQFVPWEAREGAGPVPRNAARRERKALVGSFGMSGHTGSASPLLSEAGDRQEHTWVEKSPISCPKRGGAAGLGRAEAQAG